MKIGSLRINLLFFALLQCLSCFSQNLIDNSWKFSTGDSLIWKNSDFNTVSWKSIKSGKAWEQQGYAGYDGYSWYRKYVVIPSTLKSDILKLDGLSLNLGTIDDADEAYFNAKLIGKSGEFPPNFISAYDKKRNYNIQPDDILWDAVNVIAIRVYDGIGNGGLMSDVSLSPCGLESLVSFRPQFTRENQLFLNNEKVTFPIELSNKSKFDISGSFEYTILSDFGDTVSVVNQKVSVKSKSKKTFEIEKNNIKPGFYSIRFEFKSRLFNITTTYNIGVEPEMIISPTDRRADFENFWMRAKRDLAAVDPRFKIIRKDSLCTNMRDVYLVEMRSLENVLIRGWYARPTKPGKFPALLHVQGYSGNQQIRSISNGEEMAELFLNIRGHGNSRDEVNPGFPGFLQSNIKNRERYIYRGAYMDCVRAVDFLFSRDEVDNRYVMVEGGSQGGALSFVTAALNNDRIQLCMPDVPFLSDFPDYFKVAKWPGNEFVEYEKANHDFGWKGIFETLSYFDIKNLAPWIKCPVLMQIGLKDLICPPHINFAAYNQLTVPKSYIVYPESGHGLPPLAYNLKMEWMKKELENSKKTETK